MDHRTWVLLQRNHLMLTNLAGKLLGMGVISLQDYSDLYSETAETLREFADDDCDDLPDLQREYRKAADDLMRVKEAIEK